MVELYKQRGLDGDEAETVVNILAKNKDFFIDVMMAEELGLIVDGDESPVKDGCYSLMSFDLARHRNVPRIHCIRRRSPPALHLLRVHNSVHVDDILHLHRAHVYNSFRPWNSQGVGC